MLCRRAILVPSGNAVREFGVFPQLSLQLTRLACEKLKRALPARMRENESTVARAAGQLSSRPLCAKKAWRFLAGWKSLPGKA